MSVPQDDFAIPETIVGGAAAVKAPTGSSSASRSSDPDATIVGSFHLHPIFAPGTLLASRYEIAELLGQGGMGSVYKAHDRELDRFVALKTIRPEMADHPEILARFKQELILARQVTHRNVIRIFDLGEHQGTKFITMEFVEGASLHALLRANGKFAPDKAVEVMRQVCLALQAAHSEGVIHRDLKPQNIMREERSGRIVVMDFGLARSFESGMTQTGALVGTMEYMSPEQALGKDIDARSDIFAIGLIFYELLTGKMPYKADTAIASLLRRSQEAAVPARQVDDSVPGLLSEIVSKCLERECERRYQSAADLLNDLELWGTTGAVSIVAPPPLAQPGGFRITPRRAAYIGASGVLCVAVIAGGVFVQKRLSSTATQQTASAVAPSLTLAIVPFRNASGDSSLDWLSNSIAETLTSGVGQSARMHVVSSENMHQLVRDLRIAPDTTLDDDTLKRLAQFSNADQIVWGRFTKFGPQIRIDATVRDLKQQRTVNLQAQAANEGEVLSALDKLAQSVRGSLDVPASAIEELAAQALKPSTKSLEAIRHYDEGLQMFRDGLYLDAVKRFAKSTEADPQFALAYAKLSETYARIGYGKQAEEYARRAEELGRDLPDQERYRILASGAVVSNNNRKAIEYYENLAKASPGDAGLKLTLAQLYENVGSYDTARDALQKLLTVEPTHAEAMIMLAHVEGERHNPQAALDHLNRAFSIALERNNDELRARDLYETGYVYRLLNKPDEALQKYQESLVIRRRLGQKPGTAQALAEMAEIQYDQGKPEESIASYKEAMQLQREIGDKIYLSHTLLNLGGIYSDRAQYDEALKYLKESLQLQRELNNEQYEAMCLNNIANVYLSTARFDDAQTYYQLALEKLQKLNASGQIPLVLYNLADTAAHMGQYDRTIAFYVQGLDLSRKSGNRQSVALGSYSLGKVFAEQGNFAGALAANQEAVNTYRELQDRTSSMVDALIGYGSVLAQVGRFDESRSVLNEAISLAREIKTDTQLAQGLARQADAWLLQGEVRQAKALLNEAQQVAARSKDSETMLLVKAATARTMVEQGPARAQMTTLKSLVQEANSRGMNSVATQCSLALIKAMLDSGQSSAAIDEATRLQKASERMGFKFAAAYAIYLQGESLRKSGHSAQGLARLQLAQKSLQAISAESHSETFVKRSDLQPVMSAVVQ